MVTPTVGTSSELGQRRAVDEPASALHLWQPDNRNGQCGAAFFPAQHSRFGSSVPHQWHHVPSDNVQHCLAVVEQ